MVFNQYTVYTRVFTIILLFKLISNNLYLTNSKSIFYKKIIKNKKKLIFPTVCLSEFCDNKV